MDTKYSNEILNQTQRKLNSPGWVEEGNVVADAEQSPLGEETDEWHLDWSEEKTKQDYSSKETQPDYSSKETQPDFSSEETDLLVERLVASGLDELVLQDVGREDAAERLEDPQDFQGEMEAVQDGAERKQKKY